MPQDSLEQRRLTQGRNRMKPAQAASVAGGGAVEDVARAASAKRPAISNRLQGACRKGLAQSSMPRRFMRLKRRLRADNVHLSHS
jgi:hypothetical protein